MPFSRGSSQPRDRTQVSRIAGGFFTIWRYALWPPVAPSIGVCVCVCVLIHFSRVRLFCDPVDCSPPGSSVRGVLQARTLQWAATPSSRGSSRPRDGTRVSCVSCSGSRVLYHRAAWEAHIRTGKLRPFVSCSRQRILLLQRQMLHTVAANV